MKNSEKCLSAKSLSAVIPVKTGIQTWPLRALFYVDFSNEKWTKANELDSGFHRKDGAERLCENNNFVVLAVLLRALLKTQTLRRHSRAGGNPESEQMNQMTRKKSDVFADWIGLWMPINGLKQRLGKLWHFNEEWTCQFKIENMGLCLLSPQQGLLAITMKLLLMRLAL